MDYSRHIISTEASVKEALAAINALSGESMTLFAIDTGNHLVGTVTDGDVRRALLRGVALTDPVSKAMHRKFLAIHPKDNVLSSMAEGRKRKL